MNDCTPVPQATVSSLHATTLPPHESQISTTVSIDVPVQVLTSHEVVVLGWNEYQRSWLTAVPQPRAGGSETATELFPGCPPLPVPAAGSTMAVAHVSLDGTCEGPTM